MTKNNNKQPKKGFRSVDQSGTMIPTRQLLLQFFSEKNKPITFEQIAERFELNSLPERTGLSARLNRMQKSGILLLNRKNRFALTEKLDIQSGTVIGHASGFGFVACDSKCDDVYLNPAQMKRVMHGDRVLVRVIKNDRKGKTSGIIIELLSDFHRSIVGRYYIESGIGFVEPRDARINKTIAIPADNQGLAESGETVVVTLRNHPIESQHLIGVITEVLGKPGTPEMEIDLVIRKHDIPNTWPDEIDLELSKITSLTEFQFTSLKREDIRHLPLCTIDGEDARDYDDAVYCEKLKSGWKLLVAIADVSNYIKPNSLLDQEALKRGNSVYFPNHVVPMLPEALSNNWCSLIPDEDRFCMVCEMHFNSKGNRQSFRFYPAIMRSHARLTYNLVEQIINKEGSDIEAKWSTMYPHIERLNNLVDKLLQLRKDRGGIEFEFPEPLIQFGEDQLIEKITIRERNKAHKLIEECMLSANICAAEFIQGKDHYTGIYRNHEGPGIDALKDLRSFLNDYALQLGGGEKPTALDYTALINDVSERTELSSTIQTVLLRSLKQANYSTDPLGHFALNYPLYTHFTSPIRRYPDLVVHRLIKYILQKAQQDKIGPTGHSVAQIADQCSFTERRAEEATREVVSWLKAMYLTDKVGDTFSGVISGVREFGIFVQLDEILIDGMVHVTGLGNDYYHYDAQSHQLEGERSHQKYRLGDKVEVNVLRVDVDNLKVDFELSDVANDDQPPPRSKHKLNRTLTPKNHKQKTAKKSNNKKHRKKHK